MADGGTLTFTGGDFETDDPNISVKSSGENTFTLAPVDGTSIENLSVVVDDEILNLNVEGDIGSSSFDYSDGDDILLIQGAIQNSNVNLGDGENVFKAERVAASSYETGDGDNTTVLKGAKTVAKSSSFVSGAGASRFNFKGNVKDSYIEPGGGEDTLIFGGKLINTDINLGSDGAQDTIRIKGGIRDIKGLTIKGADDGDRLIIGAGIDATTYNYDSQTGRWVSEDDPEDTLKF